MYKDNRNWKIYNPLLVNRGRPSTYIGAAITNYEEDLSRMNRGKVGAPYEYTDMLIIAAFAVKSFFKMGYREAEGVVADYMDRLKAAHPNFRTMQWRVSDMEKEGIKFRIYKRGEDNLEVIIDSSGIKSVNDGEYRSTKYGKVKEWKKIHVAIDRKTRRILNIVVTGNDVGDVNQFVPLLEPIEKMNTVKSAAADGAYDSEKNFAHCDNHNINPIIPMHITATGLTGKHRRKRVDEQLGVKRCPGRNRNVTPPVVERRRIQDEWKKNSGYHTRSLVETTFSVFKGAFGEYTFSRINEMREKELLLKAVVYNIFLT